MAESDESLFSDPLGVGKEDSLSEEFPLVVHDIEELKEHKILPLSEDQQDKLIDAYDIDQPLLPKISPSRTFKLKNQAYYLSFFILW